MKALAYFEVECPEERGGEIYRKIATDILGDLDLLKIIGRLHILIDPSVPLFLAVGVIKTLPRLVRVSDFANVLEENGKLTLDISDETHLAELLRILWGKYGRDLIEQPDRWTVIIKSKEANGKEVEDIVVFDPTESLNKDLIHALQTIAPEGFKVRRQYVRNGTFYYVASEDTLDKEMVDQLIREKFSLLGVEI